MRVYAVKTARKRKATAIICNILHTLEFIITIYGSLSNFIICFIIYADLFEIFSLLRKSSNQVDYQFKY